MKITDEMLAQAAKEVDEAILNQLPDPAECKHEFAPEFYRKMAELCPSIDPATGEAHRTEDGHGK